jgi:hypothetical protein
MKLTLILSAVLSLSTILTDVTDRLGIRGPLTFGNSQLELAWSDKPNKNYYIKEYIPKGEQVESFNQMLTIYLLTKDVSAESELHQKVNWLIERKKSDAICNYQISKSPDGKEFILDFLVGKSKDGKMTIVEFNVYRYKNIEIEGQNALLVSAYSKRGYGNGITPFLSTLRADRNLYLNEMISFSLPSLKIIH